MSIENGPIADRVPNITIIKKYLFEVMLELRCKNMGISLDGG
jgi:hypothetical protein